jgi:hypothetical protein
MDEEKIKKMKCKELTAELKLVKLPIYGVKAVLIERLLSYYMNDKVNNDLVVVGNFRIW